VSITAKIVKDSVSSGGHRITTFQLKYPRFIHAEFMTHRVFSRNASSSRAIPIKKSLQNIKEDMAFPIEFKANKPGMQAGGVLSPFKQKLCRAAWRACGYAACGFGWLLHKIGAHKQYANRVTEPWSHISVVVTATEWTNFFALRYHSMAQPEICELAKQMWCLYTKNIPKRLDSCEWHLPYVSYEEEREYHEAEDGCVIPDIDYWMPLIRRSVARCARVSYLTHDGKKPSVENDDKLYERLLGAQPIHASPAEHQARPSELIMPETEHPSRSGNFVGWVQFRKTLDHENISEFKGPLG